MKNEELLKTVRNVTLIFAIAYVVFGCLMLAFPKTVQELFGIIIGVAALGSGIYRMILYFMRKRAAQLLAIDLFAGILLLVVGFLCLFYHAKALSFAMFVFGILMMAGSVLKMQNAIDLKHIEFDTWWIVLLLGLISLGLAVLLMVNPKFLQKSYIVVTGAFLLYDGVTDFLTVLFFNIRWHSYKKLLKEEPDASEPEAKEASSSASGEDGLKTDQLSAANERIDTYGKKDPGSDPFDAQSVPLEDNPFDVTGAELQPDGSQRGAESQSGSQKTAD